MARRAWIPGLEVQRFAGHSDQVWAVAALPERGQALSAGDDGAVRLWELESGVELAAFTADAPIRCRAVTEDAKFAITGDGAGQVHVLEILL
jgi:WD40 repeat protein